MLLDFAMQSQKFWEMGLAAGRNLRVVNYDNRWGHWEKIGNTFGKMKNRQKTTRRSSQDHNVIDVSYLDLCEVKKIFYCWCNSGDCFWVWGHERFEGIGLWVWWHSLSWQIYFYGQYWQKSSWIISKGYCKEKKWERQMLKFVWRLFDGKESRKVGHSGVVRSLERFLTDGR